MISKMVVTLDGAIAESSPWPLACSSYYTVAIPEDVALAVRNGNLVAMDQFQVDLLYSLGLDTQTRIMPFYFDVALSPVPVSGPWSQFFLAADPNIVTCVTATYAGYEPSTTSIAGTTITDTTAPSGTMPPPPTPGILGEVTTAIRENIGAPLAASQQAIGQLQGQVQGQIGYQLDAVVTLLSKLITKIESNIINTIGEVYQGAYPIGLGIPSTDQIISGEPVYSPYGIGSTILYPQYQPDTIGTLPTITPTGSMALSSFSPTSTPTEPSPSPTPTSYETSTTYNPPPTTPPGVPCPAPVVQCPDPPDIIFKPNIIVNIPKQDGTNVTVNVDVPSTTEPTTGGGYPVPPSPTDSEAPTPAPTPTEPTPSPTPTPTPTKDPPPAPLDIIGGSLSPNQTNWESGASCAAAPNSGSFKPENIWDAFGWSVVKPGEYKPPGYLDPNNWPTGTKSVGSTLMNIFGLFTQTSVKAASASVPIVNNWNDFLVLALGGVVQNWVGAPMLEFMKSTVYNINYNNPQSIPSEAECVNLYLAGEIDEQTMRCLVRANGSYDTWYSKIANSGRTKLSNDQIIQLRRRGILDDPTTNLLMRGNGVIDEQEQLWIYKATEAMPSVSDIVRFMVRDADDNEVAKRYGTDDALSTKYGAQLQSWAKGQGITDEVMQYYWRSHWEIPSNTALFEMLHRLRPNKTGEGLTGGITVSQQDIKDALVVNDVLPFWAERLMEISYKPLTRTDAQRAYFIDALSENELKDSYLDLGYNNDNADRLVRFTNQLKAKRKQTTGGTEKVPAVIKYYKNWLIGSTEATQRLRNSGLSETAAKEALQIASVQRKNDSQIKCIAGVKSQFKRYIINDIEARRDLTDIGVALENVGPLVNNWRCERASKPKELSAGQVCSAYQNNLINDVEYRRRMGAIGYQEDESGILLEICRTKKGNLNDGSGDTTRIRTQQQKDDQTAAARAITAAAMSALNPPLEP